MGKLESEFQRSLIKELKEMFVDCIVTKLDANHIQGIPDLLILYKNKWATLECKKSEKDAKTHYQPNQPYYVEKMNKMSFSRFIFPENKEEVLSDLQQAFGTKRKTRTVFPKSAKLDKVRQNKDPRKT